MTYTPCHSLERKGVYVIAGGVGGLGLELAHYLASEFQASLVLIGRSSVPQESEWESLIEDDTLDVVQRTTIRKLIEIRAAASGLIVIQGDIADREAVRKHIALTQSRFGRIDGVFQAAG